MNRFFLPLVGFFDASPVLGNGGSGHFPQGRVVVAGPVPFFFVDARIYFAGCAFSGHAVALHLKKAIRTADLIYTTFSNITVSFFRFYFVLIIVTIFLSQGFIFFDECFPEATIRVVRKTRRRTVAVGRFPFHRAAAIPIIRGWPSPGRFLEKIEQTAARFPPKLLLLALHRIIFRKVK